MAGLSLFPRKKSFSALSAHTVPRPGLSAHQIFDVSGRGAFAFHKCGKNVFQSRRFYQKTVMSVVRINDVQFGIRDVSGQKFLLFGGKKLVGGDPDDQSPGRNFHQSFFQTSPVSAQIVAVHPSLSGLLTSPLPSSRHSLKISKCPSLAAQIVAVYP